MISASEYVEILATATGPAVLGIVASIIRQTRYGWKGFRHFVAAMLMSVFTAVITGLLLEMWELPATVVTGICGMCAYSGGSLLDAVLWRAEKEIKTGRIHGIHSSDAHDYERDYPAGD